MILVLLLFCCTKLRVFLSQKFVICSSLQLVATMLSSSGCSLMLIHAADMNTGTLVAFWFICSVCWLMGSVCALQSGHRSFS